MPRQYTRTDPDVRFWAKVNKAGPIPEYAPHLGNCWLWTDKIPRDGYGRFYLDGQRIVAHRYVLPRDADPKLVTDHLCRVRNCVRPSHLELVTQQVNILRGTGASARVANVTHCPKGHPYDEANTIRTKEGRKCRTCRKLWHQDPEMKRRRERVYYWAHRDHILEQRARRAG